MKKGKNEAGITLIALTITIIVLLILAGVTILALSGDNGILQNAARAKEETEQAEKDEKEKLGNMEDTINEYVTGIEVEQVTDENPGALEGEGTDDNPYIINSIEDLIFFAHDVTNGNAYEGQTVKLGLNLDFDSNKSYVDPLRTDYGQYGYNGELKTLLTTGEGFKPIGTIFDTNISTNYFKGIFDGNGKSICNLYQNIENSDYVTIAGLFSTNGGTIKNLRVDNADMNGTTNNSFLLYGGIVGRNRGKVEKCLTSGKINIKANGVQTIYIGGIVGQSVGIETIINQCSSNMSIDVYSSNTNMLQISGIGGSDKITNCYYAGKILVSGTNSGIKFISGISLGTQLISNCYNIGKIESYFENESAGALYIAGITYGMANIENCYNIGEINCQNNDNYIGGIDSNAQDGNIENCHNVGKLSVTGNWVRNGAIAGYAKNQTINNSKWLAGTADKAIGIEDGNVTKNSIEEVSDIKDMPTILSIINTENCFKEDTNNINKGYPILNWQ